MTQEKRRFTRIPFKVQAEMLIENVLYKADEIENLSMGGCLLPLQAVFDRGTSCRIRILLTGSSSDPVVKVDGEITRCDENAVAVKFTHIDPDSLFHLQSIIRYNSPDPDAVEEEIIRHPTPIRP